MELPTASEFFSAILQPKLSIILLSLAVAISLPILLHFTLYRQATSTSLPSFLVIGPSGAGKTSLVTLFETGTPAATRTSQTPLTVKATLPTGVKARSARFRSANDPTAKTQPTVLLSDTPGHGKLRHYALEQLGTASAPAPKNLRGLVFVVDAADLPNRSAQIREVAGFLHEVLLLLQKRHGVASARGARSFPVLLAANKMDLFTALPAHMVQKALELEISEVRASRAKGLLDAGVADDQDVEREWLGEGGESVFAFEQMRDAGVDVRVVGGAMEGEDGPNVEEWWRWVADQL